MPCLSTATNARHRAGEGGNSGHGAGLVSRVHDSSQVQNQDGGSGFAYIGCADPPAFRGRASSKNQAMTPFCGTWMSAACTMKVGVAGIAQACPTVIGPVYCMIRLTGVSFPAAVGWAAAIVRFWVKPVEVTGAEKVQRHCVVVRRVTLMTVISGKGDYASCVPPSSHARKVGHVGRDGANMRAHCRAPDLRDDGRAGLRLRDQRQAGNRVAQVPADDDGSCEGERNVRRTGGRLDNSDCCSRWELASSKFASVTAMNVGGGEGH